MEVERTGKAHTGILFGIENIQQADEKARLLFDLERMTTSQYKASRNWSIAREFCRQFLSSVAGGRWRGNSRGPFFLPRFVVSRPVQTQVEVHVLSQAKKNIQAHTCFSCNSARRLLSASGVKLAAKRPLTALVSMAGGAWWWRGQKQGVGREELESERERELETGLRNSRRRLRVARFRTQRRV